MADKKDKTYIYIGGGEGVPGLPHEITQSQAKALGVLDILKDAIKNGNYAEKEPDNDR